MRGVSQSWGKWVNVVRATTVFVMVAFVLFVLSGTSNEASAAKTSKKRVTKVKATNDGWSAVVPVGSDNAKDVQVVIDAGGTATVAWTQAVVPGMGSVWVSRSNGGPWSKPQQIDGTDTESAQEPQLGVDPASGNVMALWNTPKGLWGRPFVPSTGWGRAQLIQTHTFDTVGQAVRNYHVAIDAVGDAVAVWDKRDPLYLSIWSSRYTLGGGWDAPSMIETNGDFASFDVAPQVAMLPTGVAVAVWQSLGKDRRGYWTNTFRPGAGWGTATELLKDDKGTSSNQAMSLVADGNGNAMFAWNEFDNSASPKYSTGMFSKRLAGGAWSSDKTPIAPANNIARAIPSQPMMAISRSGQTVLGWMLDDNSLRVSVAPGATWGRSTVLKPASDTLMLAGATTAIDGQGNAFAIWQQYANTEPELWMSRHVPGTGWVAPTRHQTTKGFSSAAVVAMNDRGDAVSVWFQIRTDLPGNPSSLNSRFARAR